MMTDESEPYVPEPVHPSEVHEGAGAMATATIEHSDYLARVATRFKNLWVRELMKRGAGNEEVYRSIEMDCAQQEASHWHVDDDGHGNLIAGRQA